MAPPRKSLSSRIINGVRKDGDCWIWLGCKARDGYGVMTIGRKTFRVHRISYETFKGPIPPDMLVCHTCDVPLCVNPQHLFIGTPKDNTQDAYKKGRLVIRRGDAHHNRKLTDKDRQDIRILRDNGQKLTTIARKYNVAFQTISDICRRRRCYAT